MTVSRIQAPDRHALYRALGNDRRPVVAAARAGGCDLDRWRHNDWLAMAHAITRLEDTLEHMYPSASRLARRAEIRVARRVLEDAHRAADAVELDRRDGTSRVRRAS